jgi:hypothetical protein
MIGHGHTLTAEAFSFQASVPDQLRARVTRSVKPGARRALGIWRECAGAPERLSAAADVGVADPTDGRASENTHLLSQGSRSYGVNSFQCPSETTSTAPSVTLMAV